MEKAFAYVCAAPDAAPRLLKRYCRKIYELGYVPICPKLSDSQYLQISVRRWKVWQKSRNQMNMTGSDSSVVFSQPVTGFASIAFGYPNAFWGEPQTPGIQPPIEYRKR